MMTDQAYLEEVCKASRSINYEATVVGHHDPDVAAVAVPGGGGALHRARADRGRRDRLGSGGRRRLPDRSGGTDHSRVSRSPCAAQMRLYAGGPGHDRRH